MNISPPRHRSNLSVFRCWRPPPPPTAQAAARATDLNNTALFYTVILTAAHALPPVPANRNRKHTAERVPVGSNQRADDAPRLLLGPGVAAFGATAAAAGNAVAPPAPAALAAAIRRVRTGLFRATPRVGDTDGDAAAARPRGAGETAALPGAPFFTVAAAGVSRRAGVRPRVTSPSAAARFEAGLGLGLRAAAAALRAVAAGCGEAAAAPEVAAAAAAGLAAGDDLPLGLTAGDTAAAAAAAATGDLGFGGGDGLLPGLLLLRPLTAVFAGSAAPEWKCAQE